MRDWLWYIKQTAEGKTERKKAKKEERAARVYCSSVYLDPGLRQICKWRSFQKGQAKMPEI